MEPEQRCWGLLKRRACLVPTWRGWAALGAAMALVVAIAALVVCRGLHGFLAVNDPLPGGALVVEGWVSDQTLQAALTEFRQNPYDKFYVIGGPVERGAPLSEYGTYAELGAAVLLKMGAKTNEVQAVPAPLVRQDRTFAAAASLKQWVRQQGITGNTFHLVSEGPHARRSRLLFEQAFGRGVRVGITAVPVRDYDPNRWWRYSSGVRAVTGELIAYVYARFLFRPGRQEDSNRTSLIYEAAPNA